MQTSSDRACESRPRLGLALGGGSVLGGAHVGVLEALDRAGIRPDIVTGTSVGALVGAVYASGVPVDEMVRIALGLNWRKIRRTKLPYLSLGSSEPMADFLRRTLPLTRFGELPVRFGVTATDLLTGKMVCLSDAAGPPRPDDPFGSMVLYETADLVDAVRASCAMPILYEPVAIDGFLLTDGGLASNVPAYFARHLGADIVIAVDLAGKSLPRRKTVSNIVQYALRAITVQSHWAFRHRSIYADAIVSPDLSRFAAHSFRQMKELLECGRRAAREALSSIRRALRTYAPGADAAGATEIDEPSG